MREKFNLKTIRGEKVIQLKSRQRSEKNAHKHLVKVPRILMQAVAGTRSQLNHSKTKNDDVAHYTAELKDALSAISPCTACCSRKHAAATAMTYSRTKAIERTELEFKKDYPWTDKKKNLEDLEEELHNNNLQS